MNRIITGTMIDTETLALGGEALIWELACVPFDIHLGGEAAEIVINDPLHAVLDLQGVDRSAFHIDQGTIGWTQNQRAGDPIWEGWRAAQLEGDGSLFSADGVRLLKPAQLFEEIEARTGDWTPVWFRNSAFDAPRIDHLFEATLGKRTPWHRRQQSDIYTMSNLARQLTGYEDNRPAIADHGALSDAVGQIEQLADLTTELQLGRLQPRGELAPSI
jgi:hypothetical protein